MWDVVCSLLLAVILSLGFFYLYATREHSWTCPACRKRHIHNSILKCPDQLCKGKRPAFATFFPSSALKCSTCDLDEDHEGACCPARRPMSSSDLHASRPYTSSPPRPYTSPPRPQLERAYLHTNSPPLEGRNLYAIPFFCAQPVMVPQYHPVLPQADQMLRDQIADNIIYKKTPEPRTICPSPEYNVDKPIFIKQFSCFIGRQTKQKPRLYRGPARDPSIETTPHLTVVAAFGDVGVHVG